MWFVKHFCLCFPWPVHVDLMQLTSSPHVTKRPWSTECKYHSLFCHSKWRHSIRISIHCPFYVWLREVSHKVYMHICMYIWRFDPVSPSPVLICIQHSLHCYQTTAALVSCPDPTLSRGKGSGDHWAISWLCQVSSLDTEQPNEIALRHATMCSIDQLTYL